MDPFSLAPPYLAAGQPPVSCPSAFGEDIFPPGTEPPPAHTASSGPSGLGLLISQAIAAGNLSSISSDSVSHRPVSLPSSGSNVLPAAPHALPYGVRRPPNPEARALFASQCGDALGPDQLTVQRHALTLRGGAPHLPPEVTLVPGHTLTPLQAASTAAWAAGSDSFFPTARQANAAARLALRALRAANDTGDPAAPSLLLAHRETSEVAYAARVSKPSTLTPTLMASDGGHPALYPAPPFTLDPPRLNAPGHVRHLYVGGFAAIHKAHCTTCSPPAGAAPATAPNPCYFWSLARLLQDGMAIDWKPGHPVPAPLRPLAHRLPSRPDMPLLAAAAKLLAKGVIEETTQDQIYATNKVFMVVEMGAPLPASTADTIRGGGQAGAAAATAVAASTANALLDRYHSELTALGADVLSPVNAHTTQVAWRAAVVNCGSILKERFVMSPRIANDGAIPTHFAYQPLISFVAATRPGYWYGKLDLASFFYVLFLNPLYRKFFGFSLNFPATAFSPACTRFFRGLRAMMGFINSPFLACFVTAELQAALRARLVRDGPAAGFDAATIASIVYVDDFGLGAPTREALAFAFRTLYSLLIECHLDHAPAKSTPFDSPSQSSLGAQLETFLGHAICSSAGSVSMSLPPDKFVNTLTSLYIIRFALARNLPLPGTVGAEAAGRLGWAFQVDPSIGPHSGAITSLGYSPSGVLRFSDPVLKARLAAEAAWLTDSVMSGGWVPLRLFHQPTPTDSCVIFFTGDGSDANILSVVVGGLAALRVHLPDCHGVTIPDFEMMVSIFFLLRFGPLRRGFRLHQGCDAAGVCYNQWKNRARTETANDLLALLQILRKRYGVTLVIHWLSRFGNYAGDRTATPIPAADLRAAGVPLPHAFSEITVRGLPHEFLAPVAGPGFNWHPEAWKIIHPRH